MRPAAARPLRGMEITRIGIEKAEERQGNIKGVVISYPMPNKGMEGKEKIDF